MDGSPTEKPKLLPKERRSRKADRRAKQRAANAMRAEKMRIARLADTAIKPVPSHPPALNIACSGWFYWDWRGKFYPTQMPTKDWFSYYMDHFDTVELNAPFYAWPTVNTVKTLLRQAQGREFVYTVKACELITHIRRFEDVQGLIEDFGYIADLLGERMGCFLFQFPASFHYAPERLERIVSQLDHSRRNVVEFRHESWWNEAVYAAFRANDVIFCSCSGPKLPDDMIRTADDVYIRFHGPEKWYRYDYSDAELADWAERIKASGAKRIWAYFNNDYDANAIRNAQTLTRLLKAEDS
ncbi:DUF72 domain-containing protein [Asticcacaulis taihuensis]|uniref:Uncharacterized conserved protein YecE, DUF72 family n=1 Tax=Asticcacaulis taihuensis TaxID=260084 RepID=A0A1G4QVG8_9CAUL|nr:Uncharacterized conserved protein YecE, DUF72 family [Asticcacaulis taihuensis]